MFVGEGGEDDMYGDEDEDGYLHEWPADDLNLGENILQIKILDFCLWYLWYLRGKNTRYK